MLKSHNFLNNNSNHFIDGWYIDESLCDNLIDFFEKDNSEHKKLGVTYNNEKGKIVNKEIKDSLDLDISPYKSTPLIQKFLHNLELVLELYKKKYIFSNEVSTYKISSHYNIQKYKPGQGFHKWHCERGTPETNNRHLVWMTFLNDINDGGETEWFYQKLKVKPKKGLTLIWPTDWTYTHRGITSKTETKYIATGWYNFV